MKKITTTKTYEYDEEGRLIKEIKVVEEEYINDGITYVPNVNPWINTTKIPYQPKVTYYDSTPNIMDSTDIPCTDYMHGKIVSGTIDCSTISNIVEEVSKEIKSEISKTGISR